MAGYSDMRVSVAKAKAAADPTEENKKDAEIAEATYSEEDKSDPKAAVMQEEKSSLADISDEDLVWGRDNAKDEQTKAMYQKEINKRDKDGKDHFWKKADKELANKKAEEKKEEPVVEETTEETEVVEEERPFEDMDDETLYNLYSEMKKKGEVDPAIEAEMNKRHNPEGKNVNEGLDQDTINEGASPEGQVAAVDEFYNKTGVKPDGHNPDETVEAMNEYGGLVTAHKVKDENGTERWEFVANRKSKLEWEKEKGKGWKPWLLASLTLASVVASVISAYASDGQMILPPVDFSIFDPDAVEYENIQKTADDLAKSLNDASTKAWEGAAEAQTKKDNSDLIIGAADTDAEVARKMKEIENEFAKDMADYTNKLAIDKAKVDEELREQFLAAQRNNDIQTALDLAEKVGGDRAVLDQLSNAAQAKSGIYNLSAGQTAQMVFGLIGPLLGILGSDKNIKSFVKVNGAADLIGGLR